MERVRPERGGAWRGPGSVGKRRGAPTGGKEGTQGSLTAGRWLAWELRTLGARATVCTGEREGGILRGTAEPRRLGPIIIFEAKQA